MGLAIGAVVKLIGPDRSRNLLCDAAGELHVVIGIAIRNGRHRSHLSAEAAQQLDFFGRLGLRDDDHAAVTPRIAEMGQTDPRITSGALDHGATGFELTAGFRALQDPKGGAVFDRTARVHEFRFAENLAAAELTEVLQADQWGMAHRSDKTAGDPHRAADCVCAG